MWHHTKTGSRLMFSVRRIRQESEFSNLETTWNNLLKQSCADNPFLTWQWLYSWWKCYGQKSELMILALEKDEQVVALAPLMVRTKPLGLLKAREIVFLGSFGAGSDYLDFIITKGFETSSIEVIITHLARNDRAWDVISLTNIPDGSASIDHVKKACNKIGYCHTGNPSVVCPLIQLPSTWDEYLSTLSKSMRSDIRRKNNKLSKIGDVEYEVIQERRDLDSAMNDLIHLNRLRMKTKNLQGAFLDSQFTQFHKNLISLFFQNEILHLSFLKVNGKRIAALYNFFYNDVCFYYQSGFDPVRAKFSPGTVLFTLSIREAINSGMREYDFLQGDESYKFNWANAKRQCFSIFVYNKTFIGSLLYTSFLLKSHLKKTLSPASQF